MTGITRGLRDYAMWHRKGEREREGVDEAAELRQRIKFMSTAGGKAERILTVSYASKRQI